jgi:hypothetical protein
MVPVVGVAGGSVLVAVGAVVEDGAMVGVTVADGTGVFVAVEVADLVTVALAVFSKVGRSVRVGGGGAFSAVPDEDPRTSPTVMATTR